MMLSDQKTLLIVDDDRPLRIALCDFFCESGYRARCAEDGASALQEIRREVPDIVLSDLNMPGVSGVEFLCAVRRDFPAIRVIAMSGAFLGNGVPAGVPADAYFEKGSDLGALKRIMKGIAWVDKSPASRTASPPGPKDLAGGSQGNAAPTCFRY